MTATLARLATRLRCPYCRATFDPWESEAAFAHVKACGRTARGEVAA